MSNSSMRDVHGRFIGYYKNYEDYVAGQRRYRENLKLRPEAAARRRRKQYMAYGMAYLRRGDLSEVELQSFIEYFDEIFYIRYEGQRDGLWPSETVFPTWSQARRIVQKNKTEAPEIVKIRRYKQKLRSNGFNVVKNTPMSLEELLEYSDKIHQIYNERCENLSL